MNILDKMKDFIAPEVEDETIELSEDEAKALSEYEAPKNKAVSSRVSGDTKMVLFEPRSFEESEVIAKHLKERKAAVINLHRLPPESSQRSIDFLTGVIFALNGSIQKVGANVILCAPSSIGVDGEINLDDVD